MILFYEDKNSREVKVGMQRGYDRQVFESKYQKFSKAL